MFQYFCIYLQTKMDVAIFPDFVTRFGNEFITFSY